MPGCLSQLPLDFSSSLDPIRVVSSSPVWGSRLSVEHTKKNADLGAPGWLSLLSIWLLILAQVMILESWDRAPHQALHRVWSLLKILSLLLLALSQPMWSLPPHSFSLKGKKKKEQGSFIFGNTWKSRVCGCRRRYFVRCERTESFQVLFRLLHFPHWSRKQGQ